MRSILIVGKASAALGFPNEKGALIDASHCGTCKYKNPWGPNFIIVRNALLSCFEHITKRLMVAKWEKYQSQMRAFEKYLGVSKRPEDLPFCYRCSFEQNSQAIQQDNATRNHAAVAY